MSNDSLLESLLEDDDELSEKNVLKRKLGLDGNSKSSEKSEEYEYCSLIDKANEALKVW